MCNYIVYSVRFIIYVMYLGTFFFFLINVRPVARVGGCGKGEGRRRRTTCLAAAAGARLLLSPCGGQIMYNNNITTQYRTRTIGAKTNGVHTHLLYILFDAHTGSPRRSHGVTKWPSVVVIIIS